jgi:hypothetical protein
MFVVAQAPYGKYYLTTSSDLDYAREKFSFNLNSIKSYVLGKPQHGSISADNSLDNAQNASVGLDKAESATVAILSEDVVKVKEKPSRLCQTD